MSVTRTVLRYLVAAFLVTPVFALTNYVDVNNLSPAHPYTTWGTAATSIQPAVDAAGSKDTIYVTNGTYYLTTQIILDENVSVRSVSGRDVTIIDGQDLTRCVLITANAGLDGFTITGGKTNAPGAGIYCDGNGSAIDCIITGNEAVNSRGGGVYLDDGGSIEESLITLNKAGDGGGAAIDGPGELNDCTIANNEADEGGGVILRRDAVVRDSTLRDNTALEGGGAFLYSLDSLIVNCLVYENEGAQRGGGVHLESGEMRGCLLYGNTATNGAGVYVMYESTIRSSTIARNTADDAGGGIASYASPTLRNTIVYDNAPGNFGPGFMLNADTAFTCSKPLLPGPGNTAMDPQFKLPGDPFRNFRLRPGSPCMNSGSNETWMITSDDLVGTARIRGGTTDMGAYEYQTAVLDCNAIPTPASGPSPLEVVFTAYAEGTGGSTLHYAWDIGNDGAWEFVGEGYATITNTFTNAGSHIVKLVVSNKSDTCSAYAHPPVRVAPPIIYISENGDDAYPFDTWQKSATAFADPLDLAVQGCMVLVSNGTYDLWDAYAIDEGITIRGHAPAEEVVLNAAPDKRLFSLLSPEARLERLTLTGGRQPTNTASYGGGVYVSGGGVLSECIVSNCMAAIGGGVYLARGGLIDRTHFISNTAPGGAGAYCADNGTVTGCTFTANTSLIGGLYLDNNSHVVRSTFTNNTCTRWGAGVCAQDSSISGCTFIDNLSATNGGGAFMLRGSIDGSTFHINRAHTGAGLAATDSVISNCTVTGNEATYGGGMAINDTVVTGGAIGGNTALIGGGIFSTGDCTISNVLIFSNDGYGHGGGISHGAISLPASPASTLTVERCKVVDNTSHTLDGGGIMVLAPHSLSMRNTVLAGNRSALYGGGVSADHLSVENCTVTDNTAYLAGGLTAASGAILNSIVTANHPDNIFLPPTVGPGLFDEVLVTAPLLDIQHTCADPLPRGAGNINRHPHFRDPSTQDYALAPLSPCINAGSNAAWTATGLDQSGGPRRLNGTVDMGALETDPNAFACDIEEERLEGFSLFRVQLHPSVQGTNTSGLLYSWDFHNDGTWDIVDRDSPAFDVSFNRGRRDIRLKVENELGQTAEVCRPGLVRSGLPDLYIDPTTTPVPPYDTGGTAANTVADALAFSCSGTVIHAASGTYTIDEQIVIDMAVTLDGNSSGGTATSQLDGQGDVRTLYLSHPGAVVQDFALDGGSPDVYEGSYGGAAYIRQGTIQRCQFEDYDYTPTPVMGGAVFMEGGLLSDSRLNNGKATAGAGIALWVGGTVVDCQLGSLEASFVGGGIMACYSGAVVHCEITNSTAVLGGGAFSHEGRSGLLFHDCRFYDNQAHYGGGGLYLAGQATECTAQSNTAAIGGGYYLAGGTTRECFATDNTATNLGGGMYVRYGSIEDSVISGNHAPSGAGVVVEGYTRMIDTDLMHNTAGNGGGALIRGGSVSNCLFYDNDADNGGGAYVDDPVAPPGSSWITPPTGQVLRCVFDDNTATTNGGGINLDSHGWVTDSTFKNGYAASGGGTYFRSGGTVWDSVFTNNFSPRGGGFAMASGGRVDRCLMVDNGAPSSGKGGGGYISKGGTVHNSLFHRNTANDSGGGLFCNVAASIMHCTLTDNGAGSGIDGIHGFLGTPGSISVANSVCYDNGTTNYGGSVQFSDSCTTPDPGGSGNITGDPLFVSPAAANYRLDDGSPCIDDAMHLIAPERDLDGIMRALDGDNSGTAAPDMGAYEFASAVADTDSDGLTDADEVGTHHTDPTDDDTDGDSARDGGEIIAATDPLDPFDVFMINHVGHAGGLPIVGWNGATSRIYTVTWVPALTNAPWPILPAGEKLFGHEGTMRFTNPIPTYGFFRLQVKMAE